MYLILEPKGPMTSEMYGWYTDDLNIVYNVIKTKSEYKIYEISGLRLIKEITAEYKVKHETISDDV